MFNTLQRLALGWSKSAVTLHPTATCPACGSQLAQAADRWPEYPPRLQGSPPAGPPEVAPSQPDDWQCPNPDCPPQVLKRVVLWASPEAMDFQGCDAALVTQLVQRGLVRDAAEFYQLKMAELASLDGFDLIKARTLWDVIQASKQREAWRVLFGLGIPNIGATEAQTLCKYSATLEDLFALGRERLAKLDGVTETVARSLTHWYGDSVNRKLVRRLAKAGINFDTRPVQAKPTK